MVGPHDVTTKYSLLLLLEVVLLLLLLLFSSNSRHLELPKSYLFFFVFFLFGDVLHEVRTIEAKVTDGLFC